MSSKELTIDVDARTTMYDMIVRVQMRNMFWVRAGFVFIKIGCWLSGAQYVKEFPISLMQNDKEVEMD